jgi:hypothetical protein
MLTPELVDQARRRDDLIRVQQQDRQQRPLLRTAELERLTVGRDFQRPQNPELHSVLLTVAGAPREVPPVGDYSCVVGDCGLKWGAVVI